MHARDVFLHWFLHSYELNQSKLDQRSDNFSFEADAAFSKVLQSHSGHFHFQVRKDGFKDNPSVLQELDLVDEDDQITHMLTLDDATNG